MISKISSIIQTFSRKGFDELNGIENDEHLIDADKDIGMETHEFEMNASTSADDLDKELTNNSISNLFKTCDTTSSPTSSTPVHVSSSPPLILSSSSTSTTTTHQEIVYNNNGYRIKSSINSDYDTNYNFEKNGSTKVNTVIHMGSIIGRI